ncbi:hypothetical protein [Streptomyces sp. ALI-76-A]|uniref:hypothetical protein n=1 Tax=Streptomyces sp. ALI-76-A TaxID=3025736 RepID=UPI00256EEB7C|nr:hypothetical protein [Streptomyces sp. ALI-76-A]MDL5200316.1 hypothetical protein [Streptomyces sp. ALI-76-A]
MSGRSHAVRVGRVVTLVTDGRTLTATATATGLIHNAGHTWGSCSLRPPFRDRPALAAERPTAPAV